MAPRYNADLDDLLSPHNIDPGILLAYLLLRDEAHRVVGVALPGEIAPSP